MAVNDSENKSRFILERKTEKGEELQQFQEAQAELVNIQAEQKNLLNRERILSGADAQNNQTLAQAAEVLAATGAGAAGGSVITAPGTKGVLKRFGAGQPKTIKTTKTVQTPNNVHVTNNNITNNNIQLAQPNIPISAPHIPMRAGGNDGTAKFKAWLSNSFAKQNEAAAIREREYQRREWSLTRSANKIIKRMGELGKSFAEKMNPKNMSNILGDQLKIVLFLMGFQYLTQNFEKVADSVIGFVDWMKGSKAGDNFFTKLKENIVYALGGEKNESLLTAFRGFFTDLGTMISENFKYFFESRGRAIKAVDFPEIDSNKLDLSQIISVVGSYFGDVMSAAFGGPEAVIEGKTRNLLQKAKRAKLEGYDDKYSHTQDADHLIQNGNDVSLGGAVMKDANFRKNLKMAGTDYNSSGDLANNVESSVKLSQRLANITDYYGRVGGEVPTAELQAGLRDLKQSANRYGDTLVSGDFLDTVGEALGIDSSMESLRGRLVQVPVKYIKVKKSDLSYENAGGFFEGAANNYLTGKIVNTATGTDGFGSYASTVWNDFSSGNWVQGTLNTTVGMIGGKTRATISGLGDAARALAKDGYTLKMVRADDPRYEKTEAVRGKDGLPLVDVFYSLTPGDISFLENEVRKSAASPDYSFDSNNVQALREIDKHLVRQFNKKSGGNSSSGLVEHNAELQDLADFEYQDRVAKAALDKRTGNLRPVKTYNRGVDEYNSLMSTIETFGKRFFSDNSSNEKISDVEAKKNGMYVMSRLIKELGLTSTQAAGIVGNLFLESNLDPKAVGSDGKGSGIAQWTWKDRKDIFKYGSKDGTWKGTGKDPHQTDLKTQTDFLIWELNNTHKDSVTNRLRGIKNGELSDASDIVLTWYEGAGKSLKYTEQDYKKHGSSAHTQKRRDYTNQFYQAFTTVDETSGKSIQQTLEENPNLTETLVKEVKENSPEAKWEKLGLGLEKEILTKDDFLQHLKNTNPALYGHYSGIEFYKEANLTHEIAGRPEVQEGYSDGLDFLRVFLDANIKFENSNGRLFPYDSLKTNRGNYQGNQLISFSAVKTIINIGDLFKLGFRDYYTYQNPGARNPNMSTKIVVSISANSKQDYLDDIQKLKNLLNYSKNISNSLLYTRLRRAMKNTNNDTKVEEKLLGNILTPKTFKQIYGDSLDNKSFSSNLGDRWIQYYNNAYRDINVAMEDYNQNVNAYNELTEEKRAEWEKNNIIHEQLTGGKSLSIDEFGNTIFDQEIVNAAVKDIKSMYSLEEGSTINSEELKEVLDKAKERYNITGDRNALSKILNLAQSDINGLSNEDKAFREEVISSLLRAQYSKLGGSILENIGDAATVKALGDNFFSKINELKKKEDGSIDTEDEGYTKLVDTLTGLYFGVDNNGHLRESDKLIIRNAISGSKEEKIGAINSIRKTGTFKAMVTKASNEINKELKPKADVNNIRDGIDLSSLVTKYSDYSKMLISTVGGDSSKIDNSNIIGNMTPSEVNANSLAKLADIENALAILNSNLIVLTGVEATGVKANLEGTNWLGGVINSSNQNNPQKPEVNVIQNYTD